MIPDELHCNRAVSLRSKVLHDSFVVETNLDDTFNLESCVLVKNIIQS